MGVAISALVLGEAIELSLIAAMAMILGGIVIGTMSRSKPDAAMAVQPIPASARPSRQSP
jgi:drug/metabolite transporter (DMT)-like permease